MRATSASGASSWRKWPNARQFHDGRCRPECAEFGDGADNHAVGAQVPLNSSWAGSRREPRRATSRPRSRPAGCSDTYTTSPVSPSPTGIDACEAFVRLPGRLDGCGEGGADDEQIIEGHLQPIARPRGHPLAAVAAPSSRRRRHVGAALQLLPCRSLLRVSRTQFGSCSLSPVRWSRSPPGRLPKPMTSRCRSSAPWWSFQPGGSRPCPTSPLLWTFTPRPPPGSPTGSSESVSSAGPSLRRTVV